MASPNIRCNRTKWKNLYRFDPNLKLVIGEQPEVEKLNPEENDNRFKYNFSQLLKLFAEESSPLVILLDDFQWGDEASLSILSYFIQDPHLHYVMLVFVYRDNEMSQLHPLHITLQELSKRKIPVTYLHLEGLALDLVNEIILDVFPGLLEWEAKQLATQVDQKTKGNPLFIILLLKHLYENHYLYFDPSSFRWVAKIEEIEQLVIPDTLFGFLKMKIEKVDTSLLQFLKVCATLGTEFNLAVIRKFFENSSLDIDALLQEGLKKELIAPPMEKNT